MPLSGDESPWWDLDYAQAEKEVAFQCAMLFEESLRHPGSIPKEAIEKAHQWATATSERSAMVARDVIANCLLGNIFKEMARTGRLDRDDPSETAPQPRSKLNGDLVNWALALRDLLRIKYPRH